MTQIKLSSLPKKLRKFFFDNSDVFKVIEENLVYRDKVQITEIGLHVGTNVISSHQL